MKSHDCHVFMQRLLPIVFGEYLLTSVWEVVTELSLFFKDLTSTTLKVSDMRRLEEQILVILCELERIFPPSLFDSLDQGSPDQTLNQTPQGIPEKQPNKYNDNHLSQTCKMDFQVPILIHGIVGAMHSDGRQQVKVIKGV